MPDGSTRLNPMLDAALDYARRGWHVFPLVPYSKLPLGDSIGHKAATTDAETIRRWWTAGPDRNIGIACKPSGLVVVDADTYKGDCEWATFAQGADLPSTLEQQTARGGLHLVYQAEAGTQYRGKLDGVRGVDIRHDGYIVAEPSALPEGKYVWRTDDAPAPAPRWVSRVEDAEQHKPAGELTGDLADIAAALAVLPNVNVEWEDDRVNGHTVRGWGSIAGAIHNATGGSEVGFGLFDYWSRKSSKYDQAETRRRWQKVGRSPYKELGAGTLIYAAREACPTWRRPTLEARDAHGQQSAEDIAKAKTGGGVTAEQLAQMLFPPVKYIVDGYIAEGCTIFAGKPKIGKSWLALDLALAVACGGHVFGSIKVQYGDVLYCALEDNLRRLQQRINTCMPLVEKPSALELHTDWPRLDQGGTDAIRKWIDDHPNPRLVIVDTLAKVRASRNQKDSTYEQDYKAVEDLQRLANEKNVSIILVTHTRKMGADDALDTVSGTLGLTGAADSVMVLDRGTNGVMLTGRGRDIEEYEVSMEFDKATCRWRILGDAREVNRSDERGAVLQALLDFPEGLGPTDIAAATGQKVTNTKMLLMRMAKAGEVLKVGRGKYQHPDVAEGDEEVTEGEDDGGYHDYLGYLGCKAELEPAENCDSNHAEKVTGEGNTFRDAGYQGNGRIPPTVPGELVKVERAGR